MSYPSSPRWAHPRPCGEHSSNMLVGNLLGGSSPPVRGARAVKPRVGVAAGLIPARAGSTLMRPLLRQKNRAHPRPCGEHSILAQPGLVEQGSSPPVRGAQENGLEPCHQSGLIPARAGSTHLLCRYR